MPSYNPNRDAQGRFDNGSPRAAGVTLGPTPMPGDTWLREGWQGYGFDQTEAATYAADGFSAAEADDVRVASNDQVTAALWSSNDESDESGGEPMDAHYGPEDLAPDTRVGMDTDLRNFIAANRTDLAGMDPGQIGHDFWLTRNRHGAGFWDRGLGDKGDRLTASAQAFGEMELYVGDDGQLYA
jgi:hypothetical protein